MKKSLCEVIKLNAGNDRNGNPRRLFLVLRDGAFHAVDEGYQGDGALPEHHRRAAYLEFATTPAQYRELKRIG